MNKIISKINILILGVLMVIPSSAFALSPVVQNGNFSASTSSATSVTETSARLGGNVSFDEGLGTAWVEYGKNYSLGETSGTASFVGKYQSAPQGFFTTVYFLDANTTYNFRICLESTAYGVTCGQTLSFKTKATPVVASASSNSNSTNSTSSSSSKSTTSKSKEVVYKSDDTKDNSQTASVVGATRDGNFLPDTFLEWIVTIALIFAIVMFGRYLYVKRQEEIEEEEKRKKEALIRAQVV